MYDNKKRYLIGFVILFTIFQLAAITLVCHPMNKKINCDPSVYDPVTKTCIRVYCHSDGNQRYRPIKWDKNTPKLDCYGCHGAPPETGQHKNASLKTCGQGCHEETIRNGFTTSAHINGSIEGVYKLIEVEDDRDCLECHSHPKGGYPAIGKLFEMSMDPALKMSSNHIGGRPMNHDCKVCHMEEFPEFHQNMAVELKNHDPENQQGRNYYALDKSNQLENLNQTEYTEYSNQFNRFCLDCHFTGGSLFGPNPFSTARPIPVILNEILYREVSPDELEMVRFWYPHNHITEDLFDGKQIMNQTNPGSTMNNDMGAPMYNGLNPQQIMDNSGPNSMFKDEMKPYMNNDMGGSGGSQQRSRMGINGAGIAGGMPVAGLINGSPVDPIMGSNPAAIIAGQSTLMAPVPLMGGGIVPNLVVPGAMPLIPPTLTGAGMITQQIPGIMAPSPVIAPGPGISMLPGIETMSMIRSGPVTMVIGPGLTPIMDPGLMIMAPVMTPGFLIMSGPMMYTDPMMGTIPMIMYPMMYTDPMMGTMPMIMSPMMNTVPMTKTMPMITHPMMNTTPMTKTMPIITHPMMNTNSIIRTVPKNMFPYYPQHMDKPQTNNPANMKDPPKEIIQNNGTASCLACHTHEDNSMLEYSLIIKIFHGHFSHQNCIVCHVPHGSQLPGLLRDRINWDKQNRSCSTDGCHKPHLHKPPLGGTTIHYEIRPEASCNVDSCHRGNINKGGMTGN
ncbi:MAG: CxxxxCH/CxxCH domain c-type cytochrome [bacterium]